jgi:hypothetical protein
MNTKYTPGPWNHAASELTPGRFSIYANGPIAYTGDNGSGIDNAEANARLMAAAPELLKALEDARAVMLRCLAWVPTEMKSRHIKAMDAGLNAIRKATGGDA